MYLSGCAIIGTSPMDKTRSAYMTAYFWVKGTQRIFAQQIAAAVYAERRQIAVRKNIVLQKDLRAGSEAYIKPFFRL